MNKRMYIYIYIYIYIIIYVTYFKKPLLLFLMIVISWIIFEKNYAWLVSLA